MGILSFRRLTDKAGSKAQPQHQAGESKESPVNPFGHLGAQPADWEGILILRSGVPVFVRPLAAGDAALYASFLKNVTPEDRRMRFFGPVGEPSESFLRLLVDVDHSHDAAFAAFDPAGGTMLGAVRLCAPDDLTSGEFAILVRSDLKGQGLGWALMQLIITYARMRGIPEVHGSVLRENTTMLEMCAHLGFRIGAAPDDARVAHVSLPVDTAMTSLFRPKADAAK